MKQKHTTIGETQTPHVIVDSGTSGGSTDAFARSRVSNPLTLFDSKQIFDNQPLFWDDSEVSGSGTSSTHSAPKARTQLAVGASTAGKRVRQTFMRFNYQPGKSQLVIMTGVLGSGESGITSEIGMHDDDNGIFYRCDDGVLYTVVKSSGSGSAVDNAIAQSSWNIDPMDGTGDSGLTLDPDTTNIYFFDFEWLGVGSVRMGVFIDGSPYYTHAFHHANSLTEVYMSTPNLPLRYSIENDGTGGASTLDHICSTVISEGGSPDLGILRYKSTEGTHIDASTENTVYALLGIKLKAAYLGASVKLISVSTQIQTGAENGEWILKMNPTVAGTFTYANETNSAIMTASGATANTVTGGVDITGGFAFSITGGAGSGAMETFITNALRLGAAIDDTVDEIVLCWRPVGGTAGHDVEASMTWREMQ